MRPFHALNQADLQQNMKLPSFFTVVAAFSGLIVSSAPSPPKPWPDHETKPYPELKEKDPYLDYYENKDPRKILGE